MKSSGCTFLLMVWLMGLLVVPQVQAATDPVVYPAGARLELSALLPPPPLAEAPLQALDAQSVLDLQAGASPDRLEQALTDLDGSVFTLFGPLLGDGFSVEALPETTRLFARLGATENQMTRRAGEVFQRPRPYLGDPRIRLLQDDGLISAEVLQERGLLPPEDSAWPAGRAARATAFAIVMGELLPGQRAAFWARSREYAESQLLAGMQYPSDLVVGAQAGSALMAVLQRDADFRADLETARAELEGWRRNIE